MNETREELAGEMNEHLNNPILQMHGETKLDGRERSVNGTEQLQGQENHSALLNQAQAQGEETEGQDLLGKGEERNFYERQ